MSNSAIEVRTGRKWRAAEAVDVAEPPLRYRALVKAGTRGRTGLRSGTTSHFDKAQGKDRRSLVQEEVEAAPGNLDKMGAHSGLQSLMGGAVESGAI